MRGGSCTQAICDTNSDCVKISPNQSGLSIDKEFSFNKLSFELRTPKPRLTNTGIRLRVVCRQCFDQDLNHVQGCRYCAAGHCEK